MKYSAPLTCFRVPSVSNYSGRNGWIRPSFVHLFCTTPGVGCCSCCSVTESEVVGRRLLCVAMAAGGNELAQLFRFPEFGPVTAANVLDYFAHSPFYDRDCLNERRRQMVHAEGLTLGEANEATRCVSALHYGWKASMYTISGHTHAGLSTSAEWRGVAGA